MNIQKVNRNTYAYPEKLEQLNTPPNPLYVVGNQELLEDTDRKAVAIIGTRNPSMYGQEVTTLFASQLAAAGIIIVSGLALGIDAIAHQAVVDQGLPTIAVQARGLDDIYPKENLKLGREIIKQRGLIVGEYKAGVGAYKQNFIARNRIVAALSDIVLVTEATLDSGTNYTVRFALELGKTVMAVPGPINSDRSAGPNNLIRVGSTPATSPTDVLQELGAQTGLNNKPVKASNKEEQLIIDLLSKGIQQSEELIAHGNMTASEFANIISLMEISGKVVNLGAGVWRLR
jgi:DNA processing protein